MVKPGRAIPCQRALNKIGVRGEPPELKHLSRARKRHQPRFRKKWRAKSEEAKTADLFAGVADQHNCVIA